MRALVYAGGFNMGFNCAEAVNFAPADWFRFGRPGTERFRNFRKPSVVSHEGLLLKVQSQSCCCMSWHLTRHVVNKSVHHSKVVTVAATGAHTHLCDFSSDLYLNAGSAASAVLTSAICS